MKRCEPAGCGGVNDFHPVPRHGAIIHGDASRVTCIGTDSQRRLRPPVAKKPNYDFEKRKKEMDRKKKKDDKRAERLQRRQDGGGDEPQEGDADAEPQADGDVAT